MKITDKQFQAYLEATPPVIWALVYTKMEAGEVKNAFHTVLFDETDHLRDLATPWVRDEVMDLVARHPEIRRILEIQATRYFIRHSWRKWLPWNWGK